AGLARTKFNLPGSLEQYLGQRARSNNKMQGIFVTGTDTGVGKTIVCGLLARYLLNRGYSVITQKWAQTGCLDIGSSDINLHLQLMGIDQRCLSSDLTYILPYTFKAPFSPHLASRMERKIISPQKIKKSFQALSKRFNFVLVEGTGGTLVPFDRRRLLIDIAKELGLSVLIVAQNKLGAINHALLTIEALKARKMEILGIIFNNFPGEKAIIARDNPRIVRELSAEAILGILPWDNDLQKLHKKFIPIGNKIWKKIA
ncbi:MAG: dethiobiotin synthase, partial [Candidatus Omnitrophota bacterium]|nr:dethiobiotin synthase [Candidatus Omnitrophota bacterium]